MSLKSAGAPSEWAPAVGIAGCRGLDRNNFGRDYSPDAVLSKEGRELEMVALWLLPLEAAIEAATGVALIIYPQAVSNLLLGADLVGAGIAVGRVAGIALLSLGLVCWLSRQHANRTAALAAMLAYNLLVTAYLMYLGVGGGRVGILLWPAIVIHGVLMLLVGYVWFDDQQGKPQGHG